MIAAVSLVKLHRHVVQKFYSCDEKSYRCRVSSPVVTMLGSTEEPAGVSRVSPLEPHTAARGEAADS